MGLRRPGSTSPGSDVTLSQDRVSSERGGLPGSSIFEDGSVLRKVVLRRLSHFGGPSIAHPLQFRTGHIHYTLEENMLNVYLRSVYMS